MHGLVTQIRDVDWLADSLSDIILNYEAAFSGVILTPSLIIHVRQLRVLTKSEIGSGDI